MSDRRDYSSGGGRGGGRGGSRRYDYYGRGGQGGRGDYRGYADDQRGSYYGRPREGDDRPRQERQRYEDYYQPPPPRDRGPTGPPGYGYGGQGRGPPNQPGYYGPGGGSQGSFGPPRGGGMQERDPPNQPGYYGPGGDRQAFRQERPRGGFGGGRDQGRRGGRGRGRGGGRPERPPAMLDITQVVTNVIPVQVLQGFTFYQYMISAMEPGADSAQSIESRFRRRRLFVTGMRRLLQQYAAVELELDEEQQRTKFAKDFMKHFVVFVGSYFFSARPIPGLEEAEFPFELERTGDGVMTVLSFNRFKPPEHLITRENDDEIVQGGDLEGGDLRVVRMLCKHCSRTFLDQTALLSHCASTKHSPLWAHEEDGTVTHATNDIFIAYANLFLQKSLQYAANLSPWGRSFIDPDTLRQGETRGGKDLEIQIFDAYQCDIQLSRPQDELTKARLTLAIKLGSKILRTNSLANEIFGNPETKRVEQRDLTEEERNKVLDAWVGTVVIYKQEKKCYTIEGFDFDHTARTRFIPNLGISHEQYFARKNIHLKYPNLPLVEVLGRRGDTIYLPMELVCANELSSEIREHLPQLCSHRPDRHFEAIRRIRSALVPEGDNALLVGAGFVLESNAIRVNASVLSFPKLFRAGLAAKMSDRDRETWAQNITQARFDVNPSEGTRLRLVVFFDRSVNLAQHFADQLIRKVNSHGSRFSFDDVFESFAFDQANRHDKVLTEYLERTDTKENLFFVHFNKPRTKLDPNYPLIKHLLGQSGHLSQFLNFTKNKFDPNDRKTTTILSGVARQMLNKAGDLLWWSSIPQSISPAMMIGIDVHHAPRVYNRETRTRGRRSSCAAIVAKIVDNDNPSRVIVYSKTFVRGGGQEHGLREAVREVVERAQRLIEKDLQAVIAWRDGIGDQAIQEHGTAEYEGIKEGLNNDEIPVIYTICQKDNAMKFFVQNYPGRQDETFGAPSGTMVSDLQHSRFPTFYVNGRAPPFSTARSVRFVVVKNDDSSPLVVRPEGDGDGSSLAEITWAECHTYPNWTGPIKVPAVVQMAHKLAEWAGNMRDSGEAIDYNRYENKLFFL